MINWIFNNKALINLPVDFRSRHSANRGRSDAPRPHIAPAGSPFDTLLPQDFEQASQNKHRTKEMRMHFRGSRAFRSNQQGTKINIKL